MKQKYQTTTWNPKRIISWQIKTHIQSYWDIYANRNWTLYLYVQSERVRVFGSETSTWRTRSCTNRFSTHIHTHTHTHIRTHTEDYVKQKLPVWQDRPQHSIVEERDKERDAAVRGVCIASALSPRFAVSAARFLRAPTLIITAKKC